MKSDTSQGEKMLELSINFEILKCFKYLGVLSQITFYMILFTILKVEIVCIYLVANDNPCF